MKIAMSHYNYRLPLTYVPFPSCSFPSLDTVDVVVIRSFAGARVLEAGYLKE